MFLRTNRMLINAENADFFILFRVNLCSSASYIKFGGNDFFMLAVIPAPKLLNFFLLPDLLLFGSLLY